jgi:hypothetical protein
MTMGNGICHNHKIYNAETTPHGQRFLSGQIPRVRGFEMDYTLNNHKEMSDSTNETQAFGQSNQSEGSKLIIPSTHTQTGTHSVH